MQKILKRHSNGLKYENIVLLVRNWTIVALKSSFIDRFLSFWHQKFAFKIALTMVFMFLENFEFLTKLEIIEKYILCFSLFIFD